VQQAGLHDVAVEKAEDDFLPFVACELPKQ
jgi:hypothetical protein